MQKIWKREVNLNGINAFSKNTLVSHLGIEFIEATENSLTATMPVDVRTHQPLGLLHGGASVVLAETLGSTAANLAVPGDHYCVGLEINANHIKAIRSGTVVGTTRPVHLGRTTQVWQIDIQNGDGQLVCVSRLTMAVLKQPKEIP